MLTASKCYGCEHCFVFIDEKVQKFYNIEENLPSSWPTMTIKATEKDKGLEQLLQIINFLDDNGAVRSSLVYAIGGGVVTDLVGFAASIYKRGVKLINVPTTLMAMLDASIGGKTAINYRNTKNQIGTFYPAKEIIVDTNFLGTLPYEELISGYGELLKYAILMGGDFYRRVLSIDMSRHITAEEWSPIIKTASLYKQKIVDEDLLDTGFRCKLNLGHTIAHAIEALAMSKNKRISHGHAVVIGLIVELYISRIVLGMDKEPLYNIVNKTRETYPLYTFDCSDYPIILQAMSKDKKNQDIGINFVLVEKIGQVVLHTIKDHSIITEGLDFYRDII